MEVEYRLKTKGEEITYAAYNITSDIVKYRGQTKEKKEIFIWHNKESAETARKWIKSNKGLETKIETTITLPFGIKITI
jgi:hypothetical protein